MALAMTLAAALVGGCRPPDDIDSGVRVASIRFDQDPPRVGTNAITIELADATGAPVSVGSVELEGNMSHAGMRPVFTRLEAESRGSGRYRGAIHFTRGGDWYLLVSGGGGERGGFQAKVDVAGVRSR